MARELVLKAGEVDVRGIVSINRQSAGDKLRAYLKKPASFVLFILICLAAALTAGAVLWVLGYTIVQGVINLRLDLFAWKWTADNLSMMPALINTLVIALLSLLIAGVIGIFAAIFMVEYAKSTNVFVKVIRVAAETLASIPSIVYGIFGMIFFTLLFGWGYCLLAGALTMALMIMPTIMRTTEEALLAVPASFREGSYALGAGKLRTIFVRRSGILPRGLVRPRRGEAAHHLRHHPPLGDAGHHLGRHPRPRPRRRRDDGARLYGRFCRQRGIAFRLDADGQHADRVYVFAHQ